MMAQYGAFSTAAAVNMRGGAALYPTTTATSRVPGGEIVSTDGPFAETKEVLTG